MDASKAEIKDLGNKLSDEAEAVNTKDMSKDLESLNNLVQKKELPVITIREKDIKLLETELDITAEEAKSELIRFQGDTKKAIDAFLSNFKFD